MWLVCEYCLSIAWLLGDVYVIIAWLVCEYCVIIV